MPKIKNNVLSLNFFQGWMRALKIERSGNEQSWSAQNKVNSLDEIGEALKEAVNTTCSKGCYASIVIDHDTLRHKTLDIPKMTSKDLHVFVKRKVNQFKECEGNVAYCYARAKTKDKHFVSINYMPMSLVEDMKRACTDAGLFLMQIMPFLCVRMQQFRELTIVETEAAMFVVKMFDKVNLIIGNSEGSIFSDRGLRADMENDEDVERIIKEVKRSILYNKQQFGGKVVLVKVSERSKEKLFKSLQESLDIPVEWLSESKRFFWNREVLSISFKDRDNLLFRKTRNEMTIRKYTKVAAVFILALWTASLMTFTFVEYLLHKERKLLVDVKPQIAELQNSKDLLMQRQAELFQLERTSNKLKKERLMPVPGWFLGYLCNEVPDGLILTKTRVSHKEDTWEIDIEGLSKSGQQDTTKKLKMFCSNLRNGPFKMQVSKDWYDIWLKQLKGGSVGGSRVRKFFINGLIR